MEAQAAQLLLAEVRRLSQRNADLAVLSATAKGVAARQVQEELLENQRGLNALYTPVAALAGVVVRPSKGDAPAATAVAPTHADPAVAVAGDKKGKKGKKAPGVPVAASADADGAAPGQGRQNGDEHEMNGAAHEAPNGDDSALVPKKVEASAANAKELVTRGPKGKKDEKMKKTETQAATVGEDTSAAALAAEQPETASKEAAEAAGAKQDRKALKLAEKKAKKTEKLAEKKSKAGKKQGGAETAVVDDATQAATTAENGDSGAPNAVPVTKAKAKAKPKPKPKRHAVPSTTAAADDGAADGGAAPAGAASPQE